MFFIILAVIGATMIEAFFSRRELLLPSGKHLSGTFWLFSLPHPGRFILEKVHQQVMRHKNVGLPSSSSRMKKWF